MSRPASPSVVTFEIRNATGGVMDIVVRPGYLRSLADLQRLRADLRAELPPGWTLVGA